MASVPGFLEPSIDRGAGPDDMPHEPEPGRGEKPSQVPEDAGAEDNQPGETEVEEDVPFGDA